jgi:hypothetical protein
MGERYVVCLPPTRQQLDSLDNSLSEKLEKKIERFIDAFDVRSVFRKEEIRSHIHQVGHRGDGTRGLCTHWEGTFTEVLLVFVIYKKSDEGAFLSDLDRYNERAQEYHEMLDGTSEEKFHEWLEELKMDSDYLVLDSSGERY